MNWGWHWATSAPGAPDDMELSRRVADYVASMPNRSRFVLGTHLYGMDWPNGGGPANEATALEYADVQALIARYGAKPVLDPQADSWVFSYTDAAGVPHEVWYPGRGHDRQARAARARPRPRHRLLAARPGGPAHLGRPADRARLELAVRAPS